MNLEAPLGGLVDSGWWPHLAMLLRRREEVAPTLASFYALGAKRNGWLFHRAIAGTAEDDRRALTAAGLNVAGLEAQRRMVIAEVGLDVTPHDWVHAWEPELEDARARGFDAAWWARFPIGPEEEIIERSEAYDRAWDEYFRDHPCVSLCVFIVGDLDLDARVTQFAATHDAVLVGNGGGASVLHRTPGR